MNQEEQDRRIDYIEFPTTDMEKTKAFYTEVFGWQFTDYGPDYASFADGRMNGGFRTEQEVDPGGALVVVYAKNLEQLETAITSCGGSIVKETFDFPGGRRFHFADPSGNVLSVWSDR